MNERDQEIYRGGYEAFRNLVLLRLKDARSWLGGPKRGAKFEDGFSCAATIAESMVRVPQLLFMQAPPSPTETNGQKWEYFVITYDPKEKDLDAIGRIGWELVSTAMGPRDGCIHMFFKRRLP